MIQLRQNCFRSWVSLSLCAALIGNSVSMPWAAHASEVQSYFTASTDPDPDPRFSEFLESPDEILMEVFDLTERMAAKVAPLREQLGEEGFIKELEKGQTRLEVEGLGSAKLTILDETVPTLRVVHERTGIGFLILDQDRIKPDSKNLHQYLARQHIENKRHFLLLWMRNGKLENDRIEQSPAPKFLSRENGRWWKTFWRATYKKPTKGDAVMGTVSALFQAGIAAGLSGINVAINPGSEFDLVPSLLSIGFGVPIGTYASTYRNWVKRKTHRLVQGMKQSTVSLAFAYTLTALTKDGGLYALSLMSPEGLLLNASLLANVYANGLAKNEWHQINFLRDELGKNVDPIKINLPGGKKIEMNRGSVEYQAMYGVPYATRLADLIGMSATLPFMGVVPLGKLLLWSSIPLAQEITAWYAKALGSEERAEAKRQQSWARIPARVFRKMFERIEQRRIRRCEAKLLPEDETRNSDEAA